MEVRYPPSKGVSQRYLRDTYENRANGCDTPLCDTISKGYCAIWGGISPWAAKGKMPCPSFPCRVHTNLVKWFFSYSPPPDRDSSPTTTDPPPQGVDFRSFSSRFRVDFESRLENDSKTTEKTTRNRLPGKGGRWWWGTNPGGRAVAEKQFHYTNPLSAGNSL